MTTAPKYVFFIIIFTGLLLTGRFYFQKYQNEKLDTSTNSTTIQNTSVQSPTATPTLSTKENYNWKTYKNDKIGVSFEYPDYFEIEEREFDNRNKNEYEGTPYQRYSFGVAFSTKESRMIESYLKEIYFDFGTQLNPEYDNKTRKKFILKTIGDYEWEKYDSYDCTSKPKDGKICFDNWGGWFLSYELNKNGFVYSFSLVNESLDNSSDFIRMLETMVISPPQLDTP